MKIPAETSATNPLKRKVSESDIGGQISNHVKRLKDEVDQKAEQAPVTSIEMEPIQLPGAPASQTPVKPPASLLTIESEIRLEILRHLLLLERNQVVKHTSPHLWEARFQALATNPYASKGKYTRGPGLTTIAADNFLQCGLQREIKYHPQVQILEVCKRLQAEGEDIFYKENHYIGVHEPPFDLLNVLRQLGMGYRRWRGACDRLIRSAPDLCKFLQLIS